MSVSITVTVSSSIIGSICISYVMYLKVCNHKRIGIYYLLVSLCTGFQGTYISIIMRIELDSSGIRIIPTANMNIYNLNITLHGLLMIFFLVMPGLFGGFGNILLPIYLGAPEVTYPRINNGSLLLLLLSFFIQLTSITMEFAIGTGWTLYPPLSTSHYSLSSLGI
jgi:cytochrome c oxidase subunit 1